MSTLDENKLRDHKNMRRRIYIYIYIEMKTKPKKGNAKVEGSKRRSSNNQLNQARLRKENPKAKYLQKF